MKVDGKGMQVKGKGIRNGTSAVRKRNGAIIDKPVTIASSFAFFSVMRARKGNF
jgi:hypothetical protein